MKEMELYRAQHGESDSLETTLPNYSFALDLECAKIYYFTPNYKNMASGEPKLFKANVAVNKTYVSKTSFIEIEDVIRDHGIDEAMELIKIGKPWIELTDTWGAIKGGFDCVVEWSKANTDNIDALCVPLYQLLDRESGHNWFIKNKYDSVEFRGSGMTSKHYEMRLLNKQAILSFKRIK